MTIKDKLQHAAVATILVVLAYFLLGNAYYGAVAAIAGFFGREHESAVWYRRTKQMVQESRLKSDLYCFQVWTWRLDNQWDWYASFVAVPVAYLMMTFL